MFGLGGAHTNTYWVDDVELIPDAWSSVKTPSFENPTSDINAAWATYIDQGSYGSNSVDCLTASDGSCAEKFSNIATTTDWVMHFYQPQSICLNRYISSAAAARW